MNLKQKKGEKWHDYLHKTHLAVFIAIALVLVINQIVFSSLLVDRENVGAFLLDDARHFFTNIGNHQVPAGTNDVVLAEFWLPDGWMREGLACAWQLDDPGVGYDNPCIEMIDADGVSTIGPGIDDDDVKYIPELDPANNLLTAAPILFTPGDFVCADSLAPPVAEVYIDGSGIPGNCVPGDGGFDYVVLDTNAPGLSIGPFFDVSLPGPSGEIWVHSEVVQANAAYDYNVLVSGNYFIETIGQCPGTSGGPTSPSNLVAWMDLLNDGIYQPGVDIILWDGLNCLTGDGSCSGGGCAGITLGPVPIPGEPMTYDGGSVLGCPGTSGDGVWQKGEPVFGDASLYPPAGGILGIFDGGDLSLFDPAGCLAGGESGFNPIVGKSTETIWLLGPEYAGTLFGPTDNVIQQGSWWNGIFVPLVPGTQWQGDPAGVWTGLGNPGGEGFVDSGPIDAMLSPGETIILDLDADSAYTPGPDTAYDCDGGVTTGVGTCTATPGTSLTDLAVSDYVCYQNVNNIYVDDNSDCTWGNGAGGDVNIVGDCSGGLCTNNGGNLARTDYVDLDNSGTYNIGEEIYREPAGAAGLTVSLGADTDVYSIGAPAPGTPLLDLSTSLGPNGFNIIYADADGSGTLTSTDTVLEDTGTAQTGPVVAPFGNGVVDRVENALNFGELSFGAFARPGLDITNVRLAFDTSFSFAPLGTGFCQAPFAATVPLVFNNAGYGVTPVPLGGSITYPFFQRLCLIADIPPTAANNARITPYISQLFDPLGNGQFDAGDKGLFQFAQGSSGPTDGPFVAPYTIRVVGGVSPGGGGATPPASVSNIDLLVLEVVGGNVKMTWKDPIAPDLDKILIYRDHNPLPGTLGEIPITEVDKGVQTYTDTTVLPGETYKYRLVAKDIQGDLSVGLIKSITIPHELAAPTCTLPDGVEAGALIMADGQDTIYLVTNECTRNPFPHAKVYFSYYTEFPNKSDVSLSIDVISQIPMGQNMTLRPGTNLMKLATDPKVYAVEPGAVIRWVTDGQIATALWGVSWADHVVDMSDTFFIDYSVGDDLETMVYPTASLIQYNGETDIWYVEGTTKRMVNNVVFVQQMFRDEFVNKNVDATNFPLTTGDPLLETGMFMMSFIENGFPGSIVFPFLNFYYDPFGMLEELGEPT